MLARICQTRYRKYQAIRQINISHTGISQLQKHIHTNMTHFHIVHTTWIAHTNTMQIIKMKQNTLRHMTCLVGARHHLLNLAVGYQIALMIDVTTSDDYAQLKTENLSCQFRCKYSSIGQKLTANYAFDICSNLIVSRQISNYALTFFLSKQKCCNCRAT